jgi:GNAT superfamily N-acetyltransferase
MPELRIYQQSEFPAIYRWQAIAFMRMEWASIFYNDNLYMSETYPPEFTPVHFVFAEDDTLVSYASLLRLRLIQVGIEYQIYGFGNLLTFPPYRRRGYGGQVLQAATDFIRQSEVDAAILFCDQLLESFYAERGWAPTRSSTRLGKPDQYDEYAPSRMMLFVSEKGFSGRADFESQPIYIEWPW